MAKSVARFFFVQDAKMVKNIPNEPKIYQMALTQTKGTLIMPTLSISSLSKI
jgi:hypothetical protein